MDIEKLEKWVKEHPEEADLKAMNITTGQTYTIRAVLEAAKVEKAGITIADPGLIDVKKKVEDWLEEV